MCYYNATFSPGVDGPAYSARSQIFQCAETLLENPKAQILQVSIRMVNIKVHDNTIRKTEQVLLVWKGLLGESLFSVKRKNIVYLALQSLHLNKPQDFWNNVLWTYEWSHNVW